MMETLKTTAFLFILAASAGACVDSAPTPPSSTTPPPSARSEKVERDSQFIEKLRVLNTKAPEHDAKTAIKSGDKHFLCNVGRSRTVPGLTPETYALASQNCPKKCLDGVTDAIYGRNHAKYLSAAVAYSATWNQVMIEVCK